MCRRHEKNYCSQAVEKRTRTIVRENQWNMIVRIRLLSVAQGLVWRIQTKYMFPDTIVFAVADGERRMFRSSLIFDDLDKILIQLSAWCPRGSKTGYNHHYWLANWWESCNNPLLDCGFLVSIAKNSNHKDLPFLPLQKFFKNNVWQFLPASLESPFEW